MIRVNDVVDVVRLLKLRTGAGNFIVHRAEADSLSSLVVSDSIM